MQTESHFHWPTVNKLDERKTTGGESDNLCRLVFKTVFHFSRIAIFNNIF